MKKYFLALLIGFASITSCNDIIDTIDVGPTYDRESLLNNWYNYHIYPNYNSFSNTLSNLKSQVDLAKSSGGFDKLSLSELRNHLSKHIQSGSSLKCLILERQRKYITIRQ